MASLHTFCLRLLRQRTFASLPLACRLYRIDKAAATAFSSPSTPCNDDLVLQRCGAPPAQQRRRLDDAELAALPAVAQRWLQPCTECSQVELDAVFGELDAANSAATASPVSLFSVFEMTPRDAPLTQTLPRRRLRAIVERFDALLPHLQERQRQGGVVHVAHSCEDDEASAAYFHAKPFVDACSRWMCLPELDDRCTVQLCYQ